MRRFITTLGFITGLSVIGFGLYKFYQYQINAALQYCYKIVNVKFGKFSKDIVQATVFIAIENKSSLFLKISGYDVNIFMMGKKVAVVSSNQTTEIANNSVSTIAVPLEFIPSSVFNFNDIKNLVLFYFTDKNLIKFNIIGKFKAGVNFAQITIPIDMEMNLQQAMSSDPKDETVKKECNL